MYIFFFLFSVFLGLFVLIILPHWCMVYPKSEPNWSLDQTSTCLRSHCWPPGCAHGAQSLQELHTLYSSESHGTNCIYWGKYWLKFVYNNCCVHFYHYFEPLGRRVLFHKPIVLVVQCWLGGQFTSTPSSGIPFFGNLSEFLWNKEFAILTLQNNASRKIGMGK